MFQHGLSLGAYLTDPEFVDLWNTIYGPTMEG